MPDIFQQAHESAKWLWDVCVRFCIYTCTACAPHTIKDKDCPVKITLSCFLPVSHTHSHTHCWPWGLTPVKLDNYFHLHAPSSTTATSPHPLLSHLPLHQRGAGIPKIAWLSLGSSSLLLRFQINLTGLRLSHQFLRATEQPLLLAKDAGMRLLWPPATHAGALRLRSGGNGLCLDRSMVIIQSHCITVRGAAWWGRGRKGWREGGGCVWV